MKEETNETPMGLVWTYTLFGVLISGILAFGWHTYEMGKLRSQHEAEAKAAAQDITELTRYRDALKMKLSATSEPI